MAAAAGGVHFGGPHFALLVAGLEDVHDALGPVRHVHELRVANVDLRV